MSKKIVVPYTQIENLDALLAMMVSSADEETDVTIMRLLGDEPVESEQLFCELKAVSAQIQEHPNWHIEIGRLPPTA